MIETCVQILWSLLNDRNHLAHKVKDDMFTYHSTYNCTRIDSTQSYLFFWCHSCWLRTLMPLSKTLCSWWMATNHPEYLRGQTSSVVQPLLSTLSLGVYNGRRLSRLSLLLLFTVSQRSQIFDRAFSPWEITWVALQEQGRELPPCTPLILA